MSKVAAKLFREPDEVKDALGRLKALGYESGDVLVIANANKAKGLDSDIKAVTDSDQLSSLGIPDETANYYKYAVASGGIVVAVKADEDGVAKAQQALREVTLCSCEQGRSCGTSPGFQVASRMSSTNPVDAPMSGDFRRY